MKTIHKLTLPILIIVGIPVSMLFASSAGSTSASQRAQAAPSTAVSGLKCAYMVVPNNGAGFSKSPVMTVRCTPEMLKNNWQCQQACARASR